MICTSISSMAEGQLFCMHELRPMRMLQRGIARRSRKVHMRPVNSSPHCAMDARHSTATTRTSIRAILSPTIWLQSISPPSLCHLSQPVSSLTLRPHHIPHNLIHHLMTLRRQGSLEPPHPVVRKLLLCYCLKIAMINRRLDDAQRVEELRKVSPDVVL